MNPYRWIRTKRDAWWYISELRGAVFVTWVNSRDKANAFNFPADKIDEWLKLMEDMTGEELEAVVPFV